MANTHLEAAVAVLPPLDDFTRDELCELVRILHSGLVRAQADYLALSKTTREVIELADTLAPPVAR